MGKSEAIKIVIVFMATRKPQVLHIFTVGSTKISVNQPDIYGSIGDITGLKKALDSDVADDYNTVSNLLVGGRAIHISCRMSDGTSHKVLCAIAKVSTAVASLRGKSILGATVKTARIPRRRQRG